MNEIRQVLIAGSTGGIGRALVERYRETATVTTLRRGAHLSSADEVRAGAELSTNYSADHLDHLSDAMKEQGIEFDVVIVATGVLHSSVVTPEKRLADLDADALQEYFSVNSIVPALMIQAFVPLLPRSRPSVFACLSALVGSITENRLGGWYGYRASKAALNMIIRTASIEVRRKHKQACLAALHPGTTRSELSRPFTSNTPSDKLYDAALTAERLQSVIAGLTAEDSGGLFHWDGSRVPY